MSVTHDSANLRFVAAARGLGLADALIRAALAYARAEGYHVMATCPFAQRWLAVHPDERPRTA